MFGEIKKKKLKLINVLYYEYRNINFKDFDFCIAKFENHISVSKVIIQGPLIIRYFTSTIKDGDILLNFDVMIQTAMRMAVKSGYKYADEISANDYLYIRCEESENKLYLIEKLIDLYAWENNYTRGDIHYQIYLDRKKDIFTVDNFYQIKNNDHVTNNSIEMFENKKVLFSKLLVLNCKNKTVEERELYLTEFNNTIEEKNIQVKGPIIIQNLGSNIDEENTTLDYNIMVQVETLDSSLTLPSNYSYIDEIYRERCIQVVYSGKIEDLQHAFSKLELFSYNNAVSLCAEHFVVYSKMDDEIKKIEILQPIL